MTNTAIRHMLHISHNQLYNNLRVEQVSNDQLLGMGGIAVLVLEKNIAILLFTMLFKNACGLIVL